MKIDFNALRANAKQSVASESQLRLLDVFVKASKPALQAGVCEKIQLELNKRGLHLWHAHTVEELFEQTMVFLWLFSIKPHGFEPPRSKDMEIAWHGFILFTREYREFCDRIGCFIDHVPTTSHNCVAMREQARWLPYQEDVVRFTGKQRVRIEFLPSKAHSDGQFGG